MKTRTLVEHDYDDFVIVDVYGSKEIAIASWNAVKNEYVDAYNERSGMNVGYDENIDETDFRVDIEKHTLDYENVYCYLFENEVEFDKNTEK